MYLDYLDKYKGMEPYLHIPAEDWTYIKTTFAIEDVKETLATILMEYPIPYAEIS